MKEKVKLMEKCELSSEEKFPYLDELFRSIPEAMVMADTESNIFCMNEAFCDLYDYEKEEIHI